MYDVLDIAQYIILKESEVDNPISNLRLQKLLYFSYVYILCTKDKKLFHENIYAWAFGESIPVVHYEYLIYGSGAISVPYNFDKDYIAEDIRNCIDLCLEVSHKYSTGDLIDIFCSQSIWEDAYRNPFSKVITDKSIKQYYN